MQNLSHSASFNSSVRDAPSKLGRPSAEALLGDSLTIFDKLREANPSGRVIAVGFSIGAGVAGYVARHRPISGLILVTPFDSLEALARDHYWWAPVGLLLRHRMPTIDFLRDSPIPAAVIAAEHDRIVPAHRSAPLKRQSLTSCWRARSMPATTSSTAIRPSPPPCARRWPG